MADKTVAALPAAQALTGAEMLYGVQSGSDVRITAGPGMANLFFVNTAADPHNADVGVQAASFRISGYDGSEQFRVETVPIAVSYLIARGGIAGSMPVIVAGGAAADISLSFAAKGLGGLYFGNGAGTHLLLDDLGNGATGNWFKLAGQISGSPPQFSVDGADTNIDVYLIPKGTGNVRYGTYAAGVFSNTGFITIKDAGGTTRRLMVG